MPELIVKKICKRHSDEPFFFMFPRCVCVAIQLQGFYLLLKNKSLKTILIRKYKSNITSTYEYLNKVK